MAIETKRIAGGGVVIAPHRVFYQGNEFTGVEFLNNGTLRIVTVERQPKAAWLRWLNRTLAKWEKAQGWR